MPSVLHHPLWWKWQTHRDPSAAVIRPCEFEPRQGDLHYILAFYEGKVNLARKKRLNKLLDRKDGLTKGSPHLRNYPLKGEMRWNESS